MPHVRVKALEQLKSICQDVNQLDCFVLLTGGLRSSKTLLIDSDKQGLVVFNEVDDTCDKFDNWDKSKKAFSEAISKGGFYIYDYEKVKE